jgi:hypothetical protein
MKIEVTRSDDKQAEGPRSEQGQAAKAELG